MRLAIAHDYVTQRGGAERVVLSMLRAFPDATLHTLFYDPETSFPEFAEHRIVTSPINRVAPLRRRYRTSLPLLPLAADRMRIDADVVLASSSGWAHAFRTTGRLVVYCHNPARWLYQAPAYLGEASRLSPQRLGLGALRPALRRWDGRRADRADLYLANSRVVRDRIAAVYGREAEVVPPPYSLDTTGCLEPLAEVADWPDFHLVVSRLLPYKNVDVAIEAFRSLPGQRLLVVGAGPERERLAASLPGNVRMVQDIDDAQLRWAYDQAVALVAPSHEDFGLTPLEAAAFGKPTVALRGGGFLDTVDPGVTGTFFDELRPEAVREAVLRAAGLPWHSQAIKAHADGFVEARFAERLRRIVATQAPLHRAPERRARPTGPGPDCSPASPDCEVVEQQAPDDDQHPGLEGGRVADTLDGTATTRPAGESGRNDQQNVRRGGGAGRSRDRVARRH